MSRSVLLAALGALPLLLGVDLLRSRSRAIEDGNSQMKAGKAEEALGHYDKAAAQRPNDPGVHFDRGTALYGLQRWEEAAQGFLRATEGKTPELKASAFYNLGNAFYQAQKYGEAVEAFKKSLAYAPGDMRAKWNLELALRKKKDEDQKNQDKKDNKDNKDGQNKDKNKDPNAKDDPKKDGQEDQDKKDKQDDKQAQDQQDKQDKQDQQNQPQKQPDDKGEQKNQQQEQAEQDPQKPEQPQPKPEEQKQDPQQAQAKNPGKPDPAKAKPGEREIDAILDNLEKSPKDLEQELARVRAMNRKAPAKDW